MHLATYVETLRDQLVVAADTGGPESRAAVERLVPGLEAATRLILLEALSSAADEITRELAPGAVEVRLRGSDPDFVVIRPTYEAVLAKIYQSIGGYLGGLTLICTINATLTTSFLAIDRLPFFLPLGIVAGLSSMIPYAGPIVAGTGISLIALFTQGTAHGVACGIYFIVYGVLEGNVLAPLIFRRTVNVNPLVVTLSILFMGEIAGIMGAIIAVPVVAALQIVLREVLRIRRERLNLAREAAS